MSFIRLQENYNIIRSLLQMAKSNGLENLTELDFIVWVTQKLGLSQEELEIIASEEDSFSYPISDEERKKLFYDLLTIFYKDNPIDESELIPCEDLATQMNLDSVDTKKLISEIKGNENCLVEKSAFDHIYN